MKYWYQSKTIWFNIIGITVAIAGELIKEFPSGQVARVAEYVLILGNIFLRLITDKGIGTNG